jgi:hypothetical protein
MIDRARSNRLPQQRVAISPVFPGFIHGGVGMPAKCLSVKAIAGVTALADSRGNPEILMVDRRNVRDEPKRSTGGNRRV